MKKIMILCAALCAVLFVSCASKPAADAAPAAKTEAPVQAAAPAKAETPAAAPAKSEAPAAKPAAAPVFTGDEIYMSANDLTPAALADVLVIDENFSVSATAEKGVNIEVMDKSRTAADGEIFNNRIKLNGAGSAATRSVHFKTAAKASVTIYANSSSKTEDRILVIANVADGAEVGTITATIDNEKDAAMGTVTVPAAGEYCVYSRKSGINIYQIIIQ